MKPHKDFRLWLTSEAHPKFPTILLQSSIKITFEAPPGLKKNLLRTFEIWTPEEFSKGSVGRAHTLFILAWFHAIVQERRKYIPQVLQRTPIISIVSMPLRVGLDEILRVLASRSKGRIRYYKSTE